jgi:hypothetical protein
MVIHALLFFDRMEQLLCAESFYLCVVEVSAQEWTTPVTKKKEDKKMMAANIVAAASNSAYDAFRAKSGCSLVFHPGTQRHVMLLPGAVPKPPGFVLGSALYRRRKEEEEEKANQCNNNKQ